MAPSRLSNNKSFIAVLLLWLLSLGSSHSIIAQVQWECMPVQFNYSARPTFVDSTDSTLYIAGQFTEVNGQPNNYIIGLRPDGSVLSFPNLVMWPNVITKWNGKLMVGGYGQTCGLAEWDGNSWRKIDSTSDYGVFSLYPYHGKLLVGGSFSDSVSYAGVLKEYDGTSLTTFKGIDSIWSSYGITSIVEYNGDLIVAGNVDPGPSVDPRFKEIARWTGTSWQPLGNGIAGGGLDFVSDMKVINGELYVAGFFRENNGSPGNSIAKWDGTQWHRLGAGVGPGMVGVNDLEMQGDTLIVAGTFDLADGKPAKEVARYWNGHWCGNDSPLPEVATSAKNWFGNIIVGGRFINAAGDDTCSYLAKVTSWGNCFADAIAGVEETAEHGSFNLQAVPNPTTDNATIRFLARHSGTARLTLTDAVGRAVRKVDVTCQAGANQLAVDLAGLSAGLYTLQLSNATGHGAVKIVKQ